MVISFLRKLGLISKPAIDRKRAIDIARKFCQEQNWSWEEPVSLSEGLRFWTIWTNTDWIPGNVILKIDMRTGDVVTALRTGPR